MTAIVRSAQEIIASAPRRQAIAIFDLREGEFARHLAHRRRFESAVGETLTTEEELDLGIAFDGYVWSLPGEERT